MRWSYSFLFGLAVLLMTSSTANAEKRIALVIGNGAYKDVPNLSNPVSDASDVAAALANTGFDVIVEANLNQLGMQEASIRFAREARTADVALFYYSGHALQFSGVNYLVPIDAVLRDEADLRRMTRVDQILADLQQAKILRILVLDACRDNPFVEEIKRSVGRSRSADIGHGLAIMDSPDGTIISYATQSGRTADDGPGRNSPYTAAFLSHIAEKDNITAVFQHIGADVYESTRGTQVPELSLSFFGDYYLNGKMKEAVDPPATAARTDPCADAAYHWKSVESVGTIAAFEDHLLRFPTCAFAGLARTRIAEIKANSGSPTSTTNVFDGVWLVREACEKLGPWRADTYQFAGKIKDGIYRYQFGTDGEAGSATYQGRIEKDGSAEIDVKGFTGPPSYDSLHRPSRTAYHYKIAIKLQGSNGAGVRIESPRPCHSTWFRLSANMSSAPGAASITSGSTKADGTGQLKNERENIRQQSRSIDSEHKSASESSQNQHHQTSLSCSKMLNRCGAVCAVNTGRPDCASTTCVRLQQECLSTGCWRGKLFNGCGLMKR
jgi:hypothetical protein